MRALVAALAVAGALLPAEPVEAHALDEVLQQVYLTPHAGELAVELVLTPGALVAPAFAAGVDTDGDRAFGPAETAAHMTAVGRGLSLTVDGAPVPVTVTGSSYPGHATLAAGGGAVTVQATAALPAGGRRIEFVDTYGNGQKTTVQMSVTTAAGAPAAVGRITHGEAGRSLTADLLPPPAAGPVTTPAPGMRDRALAALREPLTSPWALLLLIGVSALLGALHALTPGHGKTVLAAYLAGTRSTPRQAAAMGGMITLTHTSSVLLLGTAALLAGHFILPGVLVPTLELVTGVIVLLVGLRIVRRHRRRHPAVRPPGHHHGDRHHRRPRGWRETAAMGVSGGLVPCPEALSILILAVGLHRTALGLAMIVAFGAGLAAVLVGLGLILVTARDSLAGLRPARDSRLLARLPLVSAAVVVLLGAAMTVSGVASVAAA